MNFNSALTWAGEHPVPVGVGVFLGGLALLYLTGALGGGGDGGQGALQSAYFAAQAQQGIAGSQLMAIQAQENGATARAQLGYDAAVDIQHTWANTTLATTQNNNTTALAIAPYAVAGSISSDLAAIAANAPPVTTVSNRNNNGFFGLGRSSSSTTTVSPNPLAVNAANELTDFLHGLVPGH